MAKQLPEVCELQASGYPNLIPVADERCESPDQIQKGVQVEQEHTDDPTLAKTIALGHLREDAAYYTKLEVMEGLYKYFFVFALAAAILFVLWWFLGGDKGVWTLDQTLLVVIFAGLFLVCGTLGVWDWNSRRTPYE